MGTYKTELTRSISLNRPMSVLEEEVTGDICSYSSECEDLIEKESQMEVLNAHKSENANAKILKLETRLPGQVKFIYF